ncbi:hypothetical protein [uncultured Hymenobacter sp.]|uniref:hypothetical protein n=1 Tax=uncultured Hymenobacter sp. TaxID=170016 RepID=UPI0035CBC48B
MSTEKLTQLETFIERHRPDFDAHEPGPELWARLEQQLGQPGPGVGPVLLAEASPAAAPEAVVFEKPTANASARPRGAAPWRRYGVAAALAALVVAAVLSEAHRPAAVAAMAPTDAPLGAAPADVVAFGPAPAVLAATERLGPAEPRLAVAVRGMETYYAAQLSARQAELRRFDARTERTDWPRELASLDSSYQQLKEELPHHPQPEVVLTAMNRNLQIRLDILDQQLEHRATAPDPAALPGGTMVSLADSRSQP